MDLKLDKSKFYAVAMSGGVDSSCVAALLKNYGCDNVLGFTMNLHEGCKTAIEDSKIVCQKLNIEHRILNFQNEFKEKVIDTFFKSYKNGKTPNPCAFCNRDIKLNLLLHETQKFGADFLATGHYVNMKIDEQENVFMKEAVNFKKDQSYFLSLANRENLKKIIFPLGNIESKDKTRSLAKNFGIPIFNKKDSQDICFIPKNLSYKDFFKDIQNKKNGVIKHIQTGKILGEHFGIQNYTIGQRKGLNISYSNPLYVVKIDSLAGDIFVGSINDLQKDIFEIKDLNWIIDQGENFYAWVKLRSMCKKNYALIKKIDHEKCCVNILDKSETPITPGQVCAMYDKFSNVIGAGIII